MMVNKKVILFIIALTLLPLAGLAHKMIIQNESLSETKIRCASEKIEDRRTCLAPYFQSIVESASVSQALSIAKDLRQDGYIDDCHFIAHDIGHFAYEKEGDLGRALGSCTNSCVSGCYHGATEEYLHTHYTDEQTLKGSLPVICSPVSGTQKYAECMHGIGHGLMIFFASNVRKSLEYCSYLPSDLHAANGCNDGVFMEYISDYLGRYHGEQLAEACNTNIPSEYKHDCLSDLGEGLMLHFGHDQERSLLSCAQLSKEDGTECISGVTQEAKTVDLE